MGASLKSINGISAVVIVARTNNTHYLAIFSQPSEERVMLVESHIRNRLLHRESKMSGGPRPRHI